MMRRDWRQRDRETQRERERERQRERGAAAVFLCESGLRINCMKKEKVMIIRLCHPLHLPFFIITCGD